MAVDIVQVKVDMINNHKSPIQDDYIFDTDNVFTATVDFCGKNFLRQIRFWTVEADSFS